jgi:hypothetical protein
MSKIQIFFSCPSVTQGARYRAESNLLDKDFEYDSSVYLSTVPCYLDSYIKIKNPKLYADLSWSKISVNTWTQEQVVDYVNQYKCNVLCFSVYNWNRPTIINLTRNLKSQINHDVVVIVGGPSIEAHGVYDWKQDYEDADYAVFSDGEQAFHDILCHHFYDRSLNILNTHNMLWVKNNQIQKAPAATIGDLAQALKELFKATNPIQIIGTRHGEKLFEVLLSREEMVAARDLGNYFCVPPDLRDLNYGKFIEQGEVQISKSSDYNSHNTKQLNINEMKSLLLKLKFIQAISSGEDIQSEE